MSIHDDTLLDIMSEAAKGTGVLVLVTDIALIPAYVLRAKELLIQGLRRFGGYSAQSAKAFIRPSKLDWRIELDSNGWVFFYPAADVQATTDFGSPQYVYLRNQKGAYEREGFKSWKMTLVGPPQEGDPVDDPEPEIEPVSVWEQLLDDDD